MEYEKVVDVIVEERRGLEGKIEKLLKYEYKDSAVDGDNPDKREIDKRFLHRKEKYEIIDAIEDFMKKRGIKKPIKELVNDIEDELHKNISTDIRGRKKILTLLDKNLKKDYAK